MAGIVQAQPARIVYVSCDIATFARDTRTLIDAGYALEGLTGLDLFPNTAHVESVAVFVISMIDDLSIDWTIWTSVHRIINGSFGSVH